MPETSSAITAGNAGVRPAASPLDLSPASCVEGRLQAEGGKRAPLSGCQPGEGRGGEGGAAAVCSYSIGTSSGHDFYGSTVEYIEKKRKQKKIKLIVSAYNSLVELGREEEARRLFCCGNWFQRVNFPCGSYRLVPYPCDNPFCPDCSNRRARPLRKKLAALMQQSRFDYWHLGITVQNWITLSRDGLSKLIYQFSKLRQSELWKQQVSGGIYSLEATFNTDAETWHPHFHVLIETQKRLPMDWIFKLREEWRGISGSHVMHLEKMYGVDKKGRRTRKINHRSLCEIVKYATKAASFVDLPERVGEFLDAFHGIRRVQAFGSFFAAQKEANKELQHDPESPVGCACGKCSWKSGTNAGIVHKRDTVLMADGSRQMRSFDGGEDRWKPPPPEDWQSEKDYQRTQTALQVAGQPTLFELGV